MLTYTLKKSPGVPLYEALYRCIRRDILTGVLHPGEKLPSKRALAQNLEVSKITVETAYSQLMEEGYIRAQEKVGYFVEQVKLLENPPKKVERVAETNREQHMGPQHFPFSVWSRLQREVMLDYGEQLLWPMPNRGIRELRQAIAGHLAEFRGLEADPQCILIGAGTDFLYNLLIQLLGRDKIYAVEDPGYEKIRNIYSSGGVTSISAVLDDRGVRPDSLGPARVLHISPSHHFPTGLVTPLSRRLELLKWARERNGWIIEDDYDSEFRFDAHPKPAMQSLDGERVIYMNSFSKSLAPSIRISYMVLPHGLMDRFQRELGFYSCTVPSFEQYTLARFLSRGYFEKHINRMRKFYKQQRNDLIAGLQSWKYAGKLTIYEQDAGLHFLLKVDTELPDRDLQERFQEAGVEIRCLTDFYHDRNHGDLHCLVINYSELREESLEKALMVLRTVLEEGENEKAGLP